MLSYKAFFLGLISILALSIFTIVAVFLYAGVFKEGEKSVTISVRDRDGFSDNITTLEFIPSKAALIIIGWEKKYQHMIDNWEPKLLPMLEAAEAMGMLILYPEDQGELLKTLSKHNITHLFYAGYQSDKCIMGEKVGITEMSAHGYQNRIILIRDASASYGFSSNISAETVHEIVVYLVERNYGKTTTVKDFINYYVN